MSLAAGTRLGLYEILAPLGAGGMGEVYRVRDTKLGREVAIKVLPEAFSRDPEKLVRFEREAHLLASLNHPHIATIHGLEESDGREFLVMELVEGETLADRLVSGPMPIDEALLLFRYIAEGLEAAHQKGILHRDLKPSNVMITHDGKPKILDFGLAKAVAGETVMQDLSQSPTLTRDATETGVLLGTAPYMSPEQARGRPVDKRTDIWSFGCCLYETLTGKPAFREDTVSDTIAAVLKVEPDWDALSETTPMLARSLLRRCLRKEPSERLHDVADARLELQEIGTSAAPESPIAAKRTLLSRWQSTALAVALLVVGALAGRFFTGRSASLPGGAASRFVLPLPGVQTLVGAGSFDISPDSTRIVYVAKEEDGPQKLFVRRLNERGSTPLPGTEGAWFPFFSPDGSWVAYFADQSLMKVPSTGGAPLRMVKTLNPRGGDWGPEGAIVFTPVWRSGLWRISADGSGAMSLTEPDVDAGELGHRWPQILPDGKTVLFTIWSEEPAIGLLSLATGERMRLIDKGTYARYASSGDVLYVDGGILRAVSFDLDSLELTGSAVPVADSIIYDPTNGAAQLAVSDTGWLLYGSGEPWAERNEVLSVARDGTSRALPIIPGLWLFPRLAPGGSRLALVHSGGPVEKLWIHDRDRDTTSLLTTEAGHAAHPQWTADGKRLIYRATVGGTTHSLVWKPSDGGGPAEPLLPDVGAYPQSVSPDGSVLAYDRYDGASSDIWLIPLKGERESTALLDTAFEESLPRFSPDGRWLSYVSDQTGRDEVYLCEYPGCRRNWQVSNEGGSEPLWRGDGLELFFRQGNAMMVVSIATRESGPVISKPGFLFEGNFVSSLDAVSNNFQYDVSADGQSFIMLRPREPVAQTEIQVVLNWHEELKRFLRTDDRERRR